MHAVAISYDQPSGQVVLMLAGFFKDPLGQMRTRAREVFLGKCAEAFGGAERLNSTEAMDELAQNALGRHAICDAARKAGLFRDVEPGAASLQSLQVSERALWAMRWALAPMSEIDELCRYITAAIYTNRLKGLLIRKDRDAVQSLLGAEAYAFGQYQCQPFYTSIALLCDDAVLQEDTEEIAFSDHPAGDRAMSVFTAFLASHHEMAGRILALRLTGNTEFGHVSLSDTQITQLNKLVDKKGSVG